jgi:hypothetical protein
MNAAIALRAIAAFIFISCEARSDDQSTLLVAGF